MRENVEVGGVSGRRREGVDHQADSDAALERFGLGDVVAAPANSLPCGAQRRVEIARAPAPRPDFLLLGEPAAGMNEAESDELLEITLGVRRDFDCGVLVVDHDLRRDAGVIDVFLGDTVIDQM